MKSVTGMRAAEAILLGSKLLEPVAGMFFSKDRKGGCALGMVMKAHGREDLTLRPLPFYQLYPWLEERTQELPCLCDTCKYLTHGFRLISVTGIIAAIFDTHVCGDHTWTLEQLADWVESVDPTPKEEQVVVEKLEKCNTTELASLT